MDRRVVAAVLLMMLVAVAPAVLFQRPAPPAAMSPVDSTVPVAPAPAPASLAAPAVATPVAPDSAPPPDTIAVRSSLYEYRFSSQGGRLIAATLLDYRSMLPADSGAPTQLFHPGSEFLAAALVVGRDTVALGAEVLTASALVVDVDAGDTSFSLTGVVRGLPVTLTYRFVPDD
jgi:YidC/Oxa1 family membrane protein insertase